MLRQMLKKIKNLMNNLLQLLVQQLKYLVCILVIERYYGTHTVDEKR
jgi:hypothetical protein